MMNQRTVGSWKAISLFDVSVFSTKFEKRNCFLFDKENASYNNKQVIVIQNLGKSKYLKEEYLEIYVFVFIILARYDFIRVQ